MHTPILVPFAGAGILQQRGPVLVCLKVRHGEIPKSTPYTIQQAAKELRELLAKA